VLAFVAWPNEFPVTAGQTWEFVHGQWTQLMITEPPLNWSSTDAMTYDPGSGAVILFGENYNPDNSGCSSAIVGETWEFSEGSWSQVDAVNQGLGCTSLPYEFTYDVADGYAVLLGESNDLDGISDVEDATWSYSSESGWNQVTEFPVPSFNGFGGFAYDPQGGYAVQFGGGAQGEGPLGQWINGTWLYAQGAWTDSSTAGPPVRGAPGMVFDASDGYVLMFGGYQLAGVNNVSLFNDTWVYTIPPEAVYISISTAPSVICSQTSPSCGANTDETRVSLNIAARPVTGTETWGVDSGQGAVEYGPYYWLPAPTLSFIGWKNLIPALNLDPLVSCLVWDVSTSVCPNSTSVTTLGSGGELLTWNWIGPVLASSIRMGDSWNISFNVEAMGPPYGSIIPVDSCTTNACLAVHDGPVDGVFSSLSFNPSGSPSGLSDSLPLGTVAVWPPLGPTSPSPSPVQAPPPPIVTPVPIPTPVTPVPVSPTPLIVLAPIAAGVSVVLGLAGAAAVAGLAAGGAIRVAGARQAQKMKVAIRVTARGRTRPPARGDW